MTDTENLAPASDVEARMADLVSAIGPGTRVPAPIAPAYTPPDASSDKPPLHVMQYWTAELTLMQQTVLMTAIRGPDGVSKYAPIKFLLRWYRRCILLSALDRATLLTPYAEGGGSFTGKSIDWEIHQSKNWPAQMHDVVSNYIRELDSVPHHFHMHMMHAVEILGYKHPDRTIRNFWFEVYCRFVNDMHLMIENENELDNRLGDDRDAWLERSDHATID